MRFRFNIFGGMSIKIGKFALMKDNIAMYAYFSSVDIHDNVAFSPTFVTEEDTFARLTIKLSVSVIINVNITYAPKYP